MFVDAPFRGAQHGVGQRLLEELLRWSEARGVQRIHLGTTEAFRAAHRFYEKNGFRKVERSGLPAAFPVMRVDTRFYERALAA